MKLKQIATVALVWCATAMPSAAQQSDACVNALRAAATLNGFALFAGATACARADRKEDTNLLILVGQIRSMSDLTILTPTDEQSQARAGELYGRIYSQFGGLGFDEVYRT